MSDLSIAHVALVGCGAVAQLYYAPALLELERAGLLRVSALVDPNTQNSAKLRELFPAAVSLSDVHQLPTGQIDVAIVASPPQYHAAQTVHLLRNEVSVLCEKPMATSVAEAETMLRAAETSRAVLAIGLFRRFFPAAETIRTMLALGVLGEITSFQFSEGGLFAWPVQSPSYFRKSTANGGVLIDIGTHTLDLMTWWMGRPAEIMYEDDAMGGIEANCQIQCVLANGAVGDIRLSRDCALPNRYVISGTKGWLAWDVNEAGGLQLGFADARFALDARVHMLDAHHSTPVLGPPSYSFHQSFASQIRNVIAAARGSEAVRIPGEQGIQSLRLIEACYRERSLMAMPWLDPHEQAQAQLLNAQID